MAVLRALAILKSVTGFVRDNSVNTFHFNANITEANLEGIAFAVSEFYRQNNEDPDALGAYLSTNVSHVQVKIYDVTVEPAGPPLLTGAELPLPAIRVGGANLPEEVACKLSMAGTPAAGLDQARRRGGVFLGPLRDACVTYAPATGMRISAAFRDRILESATEFAVQVDPFGELVVYSRPYAGRGANEEFRANGTPLPAIPARPGTTVNVEQFSVDDAPDTQRRRGRAPTLRTTVPSGA